MNVTPVTSRMFWSFAPRCMMGNGVEEGEELREEGPPLRLAQVTDRLNVIGWSLHTGCKMVAMDIHARTHAGNLGTFQCPRYFWEVT